MWKSQVINLLKVGMSVFTAIMIVIVVLVISCLNILISQKFLVSGINAKYYIPEHQLRLQVCHLCIGSSSCVGNSNLNLVSEPSRPTVACIRETRPNWYCRNWFGCICCCPVTSPRAHLTWFNVVPQRQMAEEEGGGKLSENETEDLAAFDFFSSAESSDSAGTFLSAKTRANMVKYLMNKVGTYSDIEAEEVKEWFTLQVKTSSTLDHLQLPWNCFFQIGRREYGHGTEKGTASQFPFWCALWTLGCWDGRRSRIYARPPPARLAQDQICSPWRSARVSATPLCRSFFCGEKHRWDRGGNQRSVCWSHAKLGRSRVCLGPLLLLLQWCQASTAGWSGIQTAPSLLSPPGRLLLWSAHPHLDQPRLGGQDTALPSVCQAGPLNWPEVQPEIISRIFRRLVQDRMVWGTERSL